MEAVRAICIGALAYAAAALAVGQHLLPGGKAWAVLLIWACAYVGGEAVKLIRLPPLLGMLLSGVILVNLPGDLTDDLPPEWSTKLRAGALAIILTRSGLELDIGTLRRAGGAAVRLTVCPGVVEACVVGGLAVAIFKMPIALGLTLGMAL